MNPLKPIADYIDKARSRIYGIVLFWLLVFLLPVIFTALFVDQNLVYEKNRMLKGEYIRELFFDFSTIQAWANILIIFAGTTLLTWLMIWKLPGWLVNRAYAEELKHQYLRENMRLEKEEELEEKKNVNIDKRLKTVEREKEASKKEEELESKEIKIWSREYETFKNTQFHAMFHLLIRCLYANEGYLNGKVPVSSDLLAFADSHKLVDYDREGRQITATDKGRYFIQRFQS